MIISTYIKLHIDQGTMNAGLYLVGMQKQLNEARVRLFMPASF